MSRPTAGVLTGAGFAQTGASSTNYAKTTGTAKASVELGTGAVNTGVIRIEAATPGVAIAPSDFTGHAATLSSVGAPLSTKEVIPTNLNICPNLVSYSQTI